MKIISNQLCACGCGKYTLISQETSKRRSIKKGEPNRYIHGHNNSGKNNHMWKNGVHKSSAGYVYVLKKDHPHATKDGYVRRSHLVVEKAMGKYLPNNAIVHHVNEIRNDDQPENLVACEDQLYHMLLHRRKKAIDACGHANWLKCYYCQQYDDPKNLRWYKKSGYGYHIECQRKWYKENGKKYYHKNKNKINERRRIHYAKKIKEMI